MIEKMKVVHIVAAQTQKTELLDALRALGIVHFADKVDADQGYLERFAALSRLITVLEEQGMSEVEAETLDDDQFKVLFDGLNACLERKKALEAERAAAVSACDTLAGWGSFSPAEIKELKAQGFELHFCRVDKKLLASLEADEEVRFLRLAPVGKQQTVAILGALPASCAAGEFIPPEKSLDEYRQEIADCERGLSECGAQLKAAAKHLPSFREQLLKTQNDADYSSVRNTSESGDGLVWLTGYLPVDEAERFKAAAAKEHWAWAMDDPAADDDKVPTKIKYTRVTRLIAPVFDILGTVPGYREYDISFWFLGFFTLFFAMIIGDAGYGCLFLLTAAALTVKSKKPSDAVQLLWVLSIATIVWGAMTGTWFGLEGAMDVPLLRSLVVPTFANYPEYFNVTTTQQQNADQGMLNVALPKGRLGDKVYDLLARIGYGCPEDYNATRKLVVENPAAGIRYFLVKPSDVAIYVEHGAADVGIVGKDILTEASADVYELLDTGLGKCRMCVAAPADYQDDPSRPVRVATKFVNIAKSYYASMGRDIDIIKLNGSIELAPILGLSDVIVDIVETGTTLRENGLKVVTEFMPISARFIANKASYQFKHNEMERMLTKLRAALAEQEAAK